MSIVLSKKVPSSRNIKRITHTNEYFSCKIIYLKERAIDYRNKKNTKSLGIEVNINKNNNPVG